METAKKLQTLPSIGEKVENKTLFMKLKELKVGVIPLPLYVALALIIYGVSVYRFLVYK